MKSHFSTMSGIIYYERNFMLLQMYRGKERKFLVNNKGQ